ncbi:hypothetical protein [Streptomyces sp. 142MFCol3.1]|uniref:hypothetical protein n=1 Tax=Streptomyces sp. 142MFCol3.1 TaxID=1172179 RepID=UPI001319C0C1|nr:hypothetical protein [Streptomyces sp. 142MFCol3.1]
MPRGEAHRGVPRSASPVSAAALDEFEVDASAGPGAAVAELAGLVTVVQDAGRHETVTV